MGLLLTFFPSPKVWLAPSRTKGPPTKGFGWQWLEALKLLLETLFPSVGNVYVIEIIKYLSNQINCYYQNYEIPNHFVCLQYAWYH